MDLATQTHLSALREALQYRLRELLADVSDTRRTTSGPRAAETHDRKDDAGRQVEDASRAAEERRDLDELAGVEAALGRLDAGHYGDCVDCGEPIGLRRLRVQPAALRCTACQALAERASAA